MPHLICKLVGKAIAGFMGHHVIAFIVLLPAMLDVSHLIDNA